MVSVADIAYRDTLPIVLQIVYDLGHLITNMHGKEQIRVNI